jgi:hypothetical protein
MSPLHGRGGVIDSYTRNGVPPFSPIRPLKGSLFRPCQKQASGAVAVVVACRVMQMAHGRTFRGWACLGQHRILTSTGHEGILVSGSKTLFLLARLVNSAAHV